MWYKFIKKIEYNLYNNTIYYYKAVGSLWHVGRFERRICTDGEKACCISSINKNKYLSQQFSVQNSVQSTNNGYL